MRTNPLGDIRAEYDHAMLDRVFYETPDYRSLLEEHSRRVVVGRRGTGKSAMFYKLQGHWASEPRALTVELTPIETASERLEKLVDRAYAEKYNTPGSRVYVQGFARSKKRRDTTTELVPK